MFAHSADSVLTILILMAVGWTGAKTHFFNHTTAVLFSRIVSTISLPALMIATITEKFPKGLLLQSIQSLWIPLCSIGLCWIIGEGIAKFWVPQGRKGIFVTMFVASNTIFVGLPVNLSLFGESAVPFALLYYLINTVFFWTVGMHLISKDNPNRTAPSQKMDLLKNIFTPPLTCLVVALGLVLFNVQLPNFAVHSLESIGALTTPLSLFFIGIILSEMKLSELKPDGNGIVILVGRFILAPLTVLAFSWAFPINPLMRNVFLMQAAMPIMAQSAVIAKACDSDYEFSAKTVSLSTLISLGTIPITFGLLHLIP